MQLSNFIQRGQAAFAANKAVAGKHDRRTLQLLAMLGLFVVAMLPELALAAPWDGAATQILAIFTGGLTRTIAIIAVIALGIAAIAGKLSWDWAIKVIIGIVFIFGAAAIVDYIIAAAS